MGRCGRATTGAWRGRSLIQATRPQPYPGGSVPAGRSGPEGRYTETPSAR